LAVILFYSIINIPFVVLLKCIGEMAKTDLYLHNQHTRTQTIPIHMDIIQIFALKLVAND